uniref:hypothetical protein n=1 Tax=Nocardia carnea TaxID=37328 RepID=UPI002456307B
MTSAQRFVIVGGGVGGGELARGLQAADTGGWREPALRTVIESLGWQWQDTDAGPVLLRESEPD